MDMVNNMFSMFDPSSSYMSISWMILTAPLFFLKKSLSIKMSKTLLIYSAIMCSIKKEIEQLMEKKVKLTKMIFLSLFMLIMLTNMMAIFSYNFTSSAHISISLSLSTSAWATSLMFGWKNKFSDMMTHLTPLGTPTPLMNFMVIIEAISNLIRPLTLSIRLSANMVAGHLLMSLMSSFSLMKNSYSIISFPPSMTLILLELGVALVQAYVLMTLLLLYQNESC